MSFTYNIDSLATDLVAQVRLKTGQTSPSSPIQDEEINYFLQETENNVDATCIKVMDALIGHASNFVDGETGQQQESRSQALKQYQKMRNDLLSSGSIIPIHAGILGVDEASRREIHNDESLYNAGQSITTQGTPSSMFPDLYLPVLPEEDA